jgi:7,8-dihydroneopterin aldolase/epimerase/oxygenase
MGKIKLEGMEFFAFHGCFREEQIIGSKFIVDLSVDTDTSISEVSDHLCDTIDYTALYRCVKEEMEQKSNLLEHIGRRIVDSIRDRYPGVDAVELRIAKINPPVGGKLRQICFHTSWTK